MAVVGGFRRRAPRWASAALVLSLVLTLTLCRSGQAMFQVETPSTLVGTFSVTIAEGDVPEEFANRPMLAGRWILSLKEDGTYTLERRDAGEVASGTYTSRPATLTFETWHGLVGCDAPEAEGTAATYAWRQSEDRLTLTAIDDACVERLTLLTSRPLGEVEGCTTAPSPVFDPFASAAGTPSAGPTPASGVAAQEGYGEGADIEDAIDRVLETANGCWATADPDSFMGLHSQGLRSQIAMMGPPEDFTRELLQFMESPLTLKRIGGVSLDDPDHAWAYIEVNLGGQPNPQRVNFVQEDGVWRLDSFFLFGPPIPGAPPDVSP